MSRYLTMTQGMLTKHGKDIIYVSKSTSSYNPTTSTVANTSTNYTIKAYPKHIKANTYNYPDLISKTVVLFYISANINFTPKVDDSIQFNSVTYKVHSFQSHDAESETILYRILAVKA